MMIFMMLLERSLVTLNKICVANRSLGDLESGLKKKIARVIE